MSQVVTKICDAGAELELSWGVHKEKWLRENVAPALGGYLSKTIPLDENTVVTIRISPGFSEVTARKTVGGYVCLPHSSSRPGGVTQVSSGAAVPPEAVIRNVVVVGSPPTGVNFTLKENTYRKTGGLDWVSKDGKHCITWGNIGSARYAPAEPDDKVYSKGNESSLGKLNFGVCHLTRKRDGANGYLFASSTDVKERVDFFFITGGTTTKVGEFIVPKHPLGVSGYWYAARYPWFFGPEATVGASLLMEEIDSSIAYLHPYGGKGYLLTATVKNTDQELAVVVSQGAARGGEVSATRTPGSNTSSITYTEGWNLAYISGTYPNEVYDWVPGPPGESEFNNYDSVVTITQDTSDVFAEAVFGADAVNDTPVMVLTKVRIRSSGSSTTRESTSGMPDEHTAATDTVNEATSQGDYEIVADTVSLLKYNVIDTTSVSSVGTDYSMGEFGGSISTSTRRVKTEKIVLSVLDARRRMVGGVRARSDVSWTTTTTSTPDGATAVTGGAFPSTCALDCFATFGDLELHKDVGTCKISQGNAGIASIVLKGNGGASLKKDEAVISPDPNHISVLSWDAVSITTNSFVAAFKDGEKADKYDEFSIGREAGFSVYPITIF